MSELYLEQALAKGALHQVPVRPQHACVVDAHAVWEQVLQLPAQGSVLRAYGLSFRA